MKTITAFLAFAWLTTIAAATTIIPPEFTQLVTRSEQILQGVVLSVESSWKQEHVIRTLVTVSTDGAESTTLEFLGGKIGEEEMRVAGVPTFTVGEEVLLFVKGNHTTICPVLGWGYGAFRIKADADGQKRVFRSDGSPLRSTAQVPRPLEKASASALADAPAMTLEAFRKSIATIKTSAK